MSLFRPMGVQVLDAEIGFRKPTQEFKNPVTLDDAALEVMTDLCKVTAVSINPCANLQQATERMISSGVQLLFVVNQHHEVLGIITKNDLTGQRAMQHVTSAGGKMDEVMVRDIMTPRIKLEALSYEEVARSRVGDLLETFKRMGRQHALVVEKDDQGKRVIRGLLSTTQIGKQLGEPVGSSHVVSTIAERAAGV